MYSVRSLTLVYACSMVVQSTAKPLAFDDALNPPLIEGSGHTTSASYRKSSRVTRWTREGEHC